MRMHNVYEFIIKHVKIMELKLVIKQITAMSKTSVKKRFSLLILCFTTALLSLNTGVATAQFTSVTNETLVNTSTAGEQWAYWWSVRTVAVQPDGGYISIWIDNNGLDGSGQGIFGQRFNASGANAIAIRWSW